MNFIEIIKAVVAVAIDVGTGAIVGHYTGNAVKKQKGATKVCATIAASAISGYVASKAAGYVNDQIDEIDNSVKKLRGKNKHDEDEEEDD